MRPLCTHTHTHTCNMSATSSHMCDMRIRLQHAQTCGTEYVLRCECAWGTVMDFCHKATKLFPVAIVVACHGESFGKAG